MRRLQALSDDELLALAPKTPEAFDEFYRRYEQPVVAYFRKRVDSAELAVDLAAETFAAAFAAARRYRPDEHPAAAWLFGIARHKLLRSLEKARVEDRARRRLGLPRLEFEDEELERVDRLGERPVADLLARLPPEQAEAVSARVLDDQSYDEVARRLQRSELVARKRVSRGLTALRTTLLEEHT